MGLKDRIEDWKKKQRSKAALKEMKQAEELAVKKKELAVEKRRADVRQSLRDTKEALKHQRARAGGTRMARAIERFGKVKGVAQKVSSKGQRISRGFGGLAQNVPKRSRSSMVNPWTGEPIHKKKRKKKYDDGGWLL